MANGQITLKITIHIKRFTYKIVTYKKYTVSLYKKNNAIGGYIKIYKEMWTNHHENTHKWKYYLLSKLTK